MRIDVDLTNRLAFCSFLFLSSQCCPSSIGRCVSVRLRLERVSFFAWPRRVFFLSPMLLSDVLSSLLPCSQSGRRGAMFEDRRHTDINCASINLTDMTGKGVPACRAFTVNPTLLNHSIHAPRQVNDHTVFGRGSQGLPPRLPPWCLMAPPTVSP
ncbi:hypothetical protein IWX90DRAFT_238429 [Phyllosticta citrichinensis]|uniref:Secreted protein n=1 Tax=Phyllosticta citrichinensis TaxID=1130410 RepID=A0ABR1XQ10_9PEZI